MDVTRRASMDEPRWYARISGVTVTSSALLLDRAGAIEQAVTADALAMLREWLFCSQ